ncbi:unnamed protein product [Dicrocoelium dendriticum]|nr:unnamed protein product [Dicrocoelium dendriticum]
MPLLFEPDSPDVKNSTIIPKVGSNICDISELPCSPISKFDTSLNFSNYTNNSSLIEDRNSYSQDDTANILKNSSSLIALDKVVALKVIEEKSENIDVNNSDSISCNQTHPPLEQQTTTVRSEGANTPSERGKMKKYKETHHSCVPSAPPHWKKTPVALPPINRPRTPPIACPSDGSVSTPLKSANYEDWSPRLVTPRCDLHQLQPVDIEQLECATNEASVRSNMIRVGENMKVSYRWSAAVNRTT